MKHTLILLLYAICLGSIASRASSLGDFEGGLQPGLQSCSPSGDEDWGQCCNALLSFGSHSDTRDKSNSLFSSNEMSKNNMDTFPQHQAGIPIVPVFRLDLDYQRLEQDIQGLDGKVEIGYGPAALWYEQTQLQEFYPEDSMRIHKVVACMRLPFSRYLEVDLGGGFGILSRAENHTGLCFSPALLFHPWSHLSFEFRPTWSNYNDGITTEFHTDFLLTFPYAALKAGWSWYNAGNQALKGPRAGLAFIL